MTDKDRLINKINNERNAIERNAQRAIRRELRIVAANVLKAVRENTNLGIAISSRNDLISEILTDTMVLAHLKGFSRSQDIAKSKGINALTQFSLLTTAISAVAARSNRTAAIPSLQDLYKPRVTQQLAGATGAIEKAMNKALRESIASGDHVKQGIFRLREALSKSGISLSNPWAYESIYRTETNLAYTAGRLEMNSDPAIQEILFGYQFSAINDSRVRPDHLAFDNMVRPKDDPIWSTAMPPLGYNCRCTIIEVFNDEDPQTTDIPIDAPIDPRFAFNPGDLFKPR